MDEAAALVEEESGENVVSPDDEASASDQPSAENNNEREGFFCCPKCGDAFREEATYQMHLQQHSQGDDTNCPETQSPDGKEHKTDHDTALRDFHSHEDVENSELASKDLSVLTHSGLNQHPPYQCEECGKSYEVFGYFLNHQRSHRQASKSVFHNLEELKKKSFQCEFCGRSYSRASALDAHRRCHEGKLVKKCRSSPESLGSDQRTGNKSMETDSSAVNMYVCTCGKSFPTHLRLKTHKRFSRNNLCSPEELYEKHKRSEHFKCSHCNKTFSGYTALVSHERWHNPDAANKFHCEECGKTFKTLTFFERHQRLAHTEKIPSKSFLHQVCQLQKKSFECTICGLKFSRASALHAHELNHNNDEMNETKLPQQKTRVKLESKTTEQNEGFNTMFPTSGVGDGHVNDTDDDDSLEPGDLIVKVISSSSSESEDNTEQDENSDLELVCESDYEVREDGDLAIHQKVVSKPNMNLKIVQIDYGEPGTATEERHDCPDCYRWFTNPVSLRVHRMWHDVRKRRQVTQAPRPVPQHTEEQSQEASESSESDESAIVGSEIDSRPFYKCKLCDKVYLYRYAYKKHKAMHEMERKEMAAVSTIKPDAFHCIECGSVFSTRDELISHLKLSHTCSSNLKCYRCNKKFASVTSWIGHLKLHEERPFWCFSCAKGFTDQGVFKHHLHLHKCRKYICKVCNKSFLFLRHLNDHSNLHTGEKPHICTYCGKAFTHSATLYAHKKSHHLNNPFKSKMKLGWSSKQKYRRLNNIERQHLQSTLQTLTGDVKMTPQSAADHAQLAYHQSDTPRFKRWEWECCDCDKGFDEVTQLHSHYIQHASGEIPMVFVL